MSLTPAFVACALAHMRKISLKEQGQIGYLVLVEGGCTKTVRKSASLTRMDKSVFAMFVCSPSVAELQSRS